jgi:HEAT repeat protein
MDAIEVALAALFSHEREGRRIHDALAARAGHERQALFASVTREIALAKASGDAEESSLRLTCIARLLGELDGADVVDALIDVLDSELPEVRNEAGEQLQGLAFERFKEVATGVERALVRLGTGSSALVELPYLLVEIPEGGVVKLLAKFLEHKDADAVAAAIETLVLAGDPAAVKLLLPWQGDKRVSVIGEDEEQTEVTIGELAIEAIELLRQQGEA